MNVTDTIFQEAPAVTYTVNLDDAISRKKCTKLIKKLHVVLLEHASAADPLSTNLFVQGLSICNSDLHTRCFENNPEALNTIKQKIRLLVHTILKDQAHEKNLFAKDLFDWIHPFLIRQECPQQPQEHLVLRLQRPGTTLSIADHLAAIKSHAKACREQRQEVAEECQATAVTMIQNYQERIELSLQGIEEAHRRKVYHLEQRQGEFEEQIKAYEKQAAALQADANQLSRNIAGLQSRLRELERQVQELRNRRDNGFCSIL